MKQTKAYWIEKLGLKAHPEGGYYQEVYRSSEQVSVLPERYQSPRSFGTSIYFLLGSEDRSAFHRLKSDEIWFFHSGSPVTIHIIHPDGRREDKHLGMDMDNHQFPQVLIPKNTWFAAQVAEGNSYVLVSCTVHPGFEFADFELANRWELIRKYPNHQELIERFT
ncbi:MAG: cupin domain-containing protein [Cytophagales bacterium]|nr:cupin domain-containing protein [Cytophagales bacterium]